MFQFRSQLLLATVWLHHSNVLPYCEPKAVPWPSSLPLRVHGDGSRGPWRAVGAFRGIGAEPLCPASSGEEDRVLGPDTPPPDVLGMFDVEQGSLQPWEELSFVAAQLWDDERELSGWP